MHRRYLLWVSAMERLIRFGWLVVLGFNGPLTQYFSLYRAVSQREGERGENGQTRVKMSIQPPPAPTASAEGPCPTVIQNVGRLGTRSLPSTIAPPDHPCLIRATVFTKEKEANPIIMELYYEVRHYVMFLDVHSLFSISVSV